MSPNFFFFLAIHREHFIEEYEQSQTIINVLMEGMT